MNDKKITEASKIYQKLIEERLAIFTKKEKLESLKQELLENPTVKEYLVLSKEIENTLISNDQQILSIACRNLSSIDLDPIYMYEGAYVNSNLNTEYKPNYHLTISDKADYFMYHNLADVDDYIKVKPSEKNTFENSHYIIRCSYIRKNYYELRNYYYGLVLTGNIDGISDIVEHLKRKALTL